MFISPTDIGVSLEHLGKIHPFFGVSFLAFKRLQIPVGSQREVPIAQEERALLDRYYSPAPNYDGYYIPFRGTARRERWVNKRYPDTTLQRIRNDTFKDALLHDKNTAGWGWQPNYVRLLRKKLKAPIPALDLAIWLYRDLDFGSDATNSVHLIQRLFDDFGIDRDAASLFVTSDGRDLTWSTEAMTWLQIKQIIGAPPGAPSEEGATLGHLALRGVGPSARVAFAPGERLTVITGDNGLGKSFLLESAWFALTAEWIDAPARPFDTKRVSEALIQYQLGTPGGTGEMHLVRYNWSTHAWEHQQERHIVPGLVFYARADSSFAIWDPAKQDRTDVNAAKCILTREEAWEGKRIPSISGRTQVLCEGLVADWNLWQNAPERYPYDVFCRAVHQLSPPELLPPLQPGLPIRLGGDVREIPTLRHPYGDVPILYASAGIRRVVTIAYLLVWAWYEHRRASELAKRPPQERFVVIVDEAEAHLHPRWQRTIVPTLMEVAKAISSAVQVQLVIATHSPLVLASVEPHFDVNTDKLFHIDLNGSNVTLEEQPFVKHGDVGNWLRSDVFGLRHARSVDAETAIEAAKTLQLAESPSATDVAQVHARLQELLPADDEFWPRWLYFAKRHNISV